MFRMSVNSECSSYVRPNYIRKNASDNSAFYRAILILLLREGDWIHVTVVAKDLLCSRQATRQFTLPSHANEY
jgi:hypothetical protein